MVVGVTVMEAFVALLFQMKSLEVTTIRVLLSPWQIEDVPEMETTGNGFTLTVFVPVALQPYILVAVTE